MKLRHLLLTALFALPFSLHAQTGAYISARCLLHQA
jgi:hypothetical protein